MQGPMHGFAEFMHCVPVTARPGQETHRWLMLVGEDDLHRLRQRDAMHLAHTQAHHAVVQHTAAIVLKELGALGEDWQEVKLWNGLTLPGLAGGLGNSRTCPHWSHSLRPGDRGPKGYRHLSSCCSL